MESTITPELVLAVMVVLIAVAITVFYLLNGKRAAETRETRVARNIDDIAASHFQGLEIEVFSEIWQEIAGALEVDPRLMDPEDPLALYIPKHLPELKIDNVERFLESRGIGEKEVTVRTTVGELVNLMSLERLGDSV